MFPEGDGPNYVQSTHDIKLGRGAWSYFGDARSISHGPWVFTGWISTGGDVWVAQTDVRTRKTYRRMIYANLGRDDHNNPSLIFYRGRLMAFFSEHSGRVLGRHAQMRYRVSNARFDIRRGFGRLRKVRTNTEGGLGYTYPNPIKAGNRLFLFWRGGDWNPTFSSTSDGRRWARARTLIKGPGTPDHPERPYAKYAEAPGASFVAAFSDAHVQDFRNSLYYLRYARGSFLRADGTRIGTLADVPFARSEVDVAYRYRRGRGRAWPHDIALDAKDRPVIVYTRRRGGPDGTDFFRYLRWDGQRWVDVELVSAGAGALTYNSGGITLDHTDPANVVLSRNVGEWNQVELWHTFDAGQTWGRWTLTDRTDGFSMRPVFPRGLDQTDRQVVVYTQGRSDGYRKFHTDVRMVIYEQTAVDDSG